MAPLRGPRFSLIEVGASLVILIVVLAVLLPGLESARLASEKQRCADNLRQIGSGWSLYLGEHEQAFPYLPVQPEWFWGGMRFAPGSGAPFPDANRPLNTYVNIWSSEDGRQPRCVFESPADRGIHGETAGIGTGRRTVFEAFGTSYRANPFLFDAKWIEGLESARGLSIAELAPLHRRILLLGSPIWFETYEETGRDADWYGDPSRGNLLLLDGSVSFAPVFARSRVGPVLVQPPLRHAGESGPVDSP